MAALPTPSGGKEPRGWQSGGGLGAPRRPVEDPRREGFRFVTAQGVDLPDHLRWATGPRRGVGERARVETADAVYGTARADGRRSDALQNPPCVGDPPSLIAVISGRGLGISGTRLRLAAPSSRSRHNSGISLDVPVWLVLACRERRRPGKVGPPAGPLLWSPASGGSPCRGRPGPGFLSGDTILVMSPHNDSARSSLSEPDAHETVYRYIDGGP